MSTKVIVSGFDELERRRQADGSYPSSQMTVEIEHPNLSGKISLPVVTRQGTKLDIIRAEVVYAAKEILKSVVSDL